MSGILNAFVGGSYGAKPSNTVAPAVTGTTTWNQVLTTTNGTWSASPAITSYTYQWYRSPSTAIGGATSSTYTLVSADIGSTLYAAVTAINAIGNTTTNSNTTATISAALPGAPTIGTATAGNATASVAFTAPSCTGGASITGYQAKSSPGCITATGSSSPISVTGLTNCTAYTFQVRAQNSAGYGSYSSSSNSVTPSGKGSATYSTPGTYTWVAPAGVTKVSVVAVGGGAGGTGTRSTNCSKAPGGYVQIQGQPGGGGGLAWINNYSVTPGNSYTVVVGAGATGQPPPARCKTYYGCVIPAGGSSYFVNNTTVKGGGAGRSSTCTYCITNNSNLYGGYAAATGCIPCRIGLATYPGRPGFSGGQGCTLGGGGASGYGCNNYVGWGGIGCKIGSGSYQNNPQNGGAGGGGSYNTSVTAYGGGGGGGVGVSNGKGSNGTSGAYNSGTTANTYGGGGSGGCNGGIAQYGNGSNGGLYGGGGGAAGYSNYPGFVTGNGGNGANGVVRIIWPGCSRKFPTTCVGSP